MRAWARRLVLAVVSLAAGEFGYRMHLSSGMIGHDAAFVAVLPRWTFFFSLVAVGLGVLLGEVASKVHAAEGQAGSGTRGVAEGVGVCVVVLGLGSALPFDRGYAVTVTLTALAVIGWAAFERSRAGWIVGALAAAGCTVLEIVFVGRGWYRYAEALRHMWNVPAWLPATYFAMGVAVSQLTRAINGALRVGK